MVSAALFLFAVFEVVLQFRHEPIPAWATVLHFAICAVLLVQSLRLVKRGV
jgi:hypothetical protein